MTAKLYKPSSFEEAGHKLFGCLAMIILIVVLVGNILAYTFSAKYRAGMPFGKFILYTLLWTALTAGFWWMMRDTDHLWSPKQKRRKHFQR